MRPPEQTPLFSVITPFLAFALFQHSFCPTDPSVFLHIHTCNSCHNLMSPCQQIPRFHTIVFFTLLINQLQTNKSVANIYVVCFRSHADTAFSNAIGLHLMHASKVNQYTPCIDLDELILTELIERQIQLEKNVIILNSDLATMEPINTYNV